MSHRYATDGDNEYHNLVVRDVSPAAADLVLGVRLRGFGLRQLINIVVVGAYTRAFRVTVPSSPHSTQCECIAHFHYTLCIKLSAVRRHV